MTVEEYLAFCAELKKIPRPEQEEQLDQGAGSDPPWRR